MISREAIKKFYEIRNIPYHISVLGEPGFDCEDKARLLVKELKSFGIEARLVMALFKWSSLHLPDKVSCVRHDDDCSHTFVEFKNPAGIWQYIDPTWNQELMAAGFPVADWDGIGGTDLALKCDKPLTAEEAAEYLSRIDYKKDIERNGDFYMAFNEYCDSYLTKGAE